MLPTLLAEGRVTVDTMRRLARLIAEFHAQAETGGVIDEAGTVATVLANWQENFDQTRPYLAFPLPQEAYDKIRHRVLAFCRVGEELFGQRIAEGRIRDGHGDLRAEHICLTEPIAIFDCIEFNRRFRHGDVAADVAFLAMDLDERGYPDLSQAFIDAYIEFSGDHGLAQHAELLQVLSRVCPGESRMLPPGRSHDYGRGKAHGAARCLPVLPTGGALCRRPAAPLAADQLRAYGHGQEHAGRNLGPTTRSPGAQLRRHAQTVGRPAADGACSCGVWGGAVYG